MDPGSGGMTMPHTMTKPPRLSIVIPTPADTAALEETLVSVLENRPDDCEIVVPLGCEYADPWNIAEEVRFVQAPAGSSLVGCINLGIASSRGEVISILAAGWRATEGWADRPLEHFDAGDVGAVIPLEVAADDHDRVLSAGIRYGQGGRRIAVTAGGRHRAVDVPTRAAAAPVAPALEAGFWRADVLELAGPGFSTVCGDTCADADMAVALTRSGYVAVVEPTSRFVPGATPRQRRVPFLSGLQAERLFWRSLAGQPVLWSLLLHGVEIVRHAVARAPFGTLPMLAGRAVGILQFGSYLPRYRQLRALMAQAATATDASAAEDGRTIRFDAGHAVAAGPRRRTAPPDSLRRSA